MVEFAMSLLTGNDVTKLDIGIAQALGRRFFLGIEHGTDVKPSRMEDLGRAVGVQRISQLLIFITEPDCRVFFLIVILGYVSAEEHYDNISLIVYGVLVIGINILGWKLTFKVGYLQDRKRHIGVKLFDLCGGQMHVVLFKARCCHSAIVGPADLGLRCVLCDGVADKQHSYSVAAALRKIIP